MGNYSTPIAVAFQKAVGEWGYVLVIAGMLISILGVAFASSFNTPALIASLTTEHSMLPSWIGKKNKHDAAWVAILFSAVISAILITQSYLFLVSCIVLASFVQYVPSIFLAVIKFKHTNELIQASWWLYYSNFSFDDFLLHGHQLHLEDHFSWCRCRCFGYCCLLLH